MAGENVSIELKAKSPADAKIEELNKKLKETERQLKRAEDASKKGAKTATDGFQQAGGAAGGMEAQIRKIGPAIAGAFSVGAVVQFIQKLDEATRKMADLQGQTRRTVVQAAEGTGDVARLSQIQQFTAQMRATTPSLQETDVAAAFSASRGILMGDDQFGRALTVARFGLERGQFMEAGQRQAMIETFAAMESMAPSADEGQLNTRAAQVMRASQRGGAGGFDAVRGLLRGGGALEGVGTTPGIMEDLLAAANAGSASGVGPRGLQGLVQTAQQLRGMTDDETDGMPMFAGSEAEIFQALASGRIDAGALARAGIAPQQIGAIRNMQQAFGPQRAALAALSDPAAARAAIGGEMSAVQEFMGPTAELDQLRRQRAEAERRAFGDASEEFQLRREGFSTALAEEGVPFAGPLGSIGAFATIDPTLGARAFGTGGAAIGGAIGRGVGGLFDRPTRPLPPTTSLTGPVMTVNIRTDDGVPVEAGIN